MPTPASDLHFLSAFAWLPHLQQSSRSDTRDLVSVALAHFVFPTDQGSQKRHRHLEMPSQICSAHCVAAETEFIPAYMYM